MKKKQQRMEALSLKARKISHHFSATIMPNVSIFIVWGIIETIIPFVKGDFHEALIQVNSILIRYLLPLLIGYTGAKLIEPSRGGVVGAIAVTGVIVGSTVSPIFAAMIIGPLSGYALMYFDHLFLRKLPAGYEMLMHNISAGFVGLFFCVCNLLFLGSWLETILLSINRGLSILITHNLLPVTNVFFEVLKVFFFNNAINHGLLTPLGFEQIESTGFSILFLIEANPGPGLGILLAFLFFGKQELKASTTGALFIHLFGGIHEIYFPFVLLNPLLFIAVVVGGVVGTSIFQLLNVGLRAPVSPGSIIMILTNSPSKMVIGVLLGIFISAACTFICASIILKKTNQASIEDKGAASMNEIKKIIFVCDAGMGSSAMGASLFRKQLEIAELEFPVSYCSIYQLKNHSSSLIICQKELNKVVQSKAPAAKIITVTHFLDQKQYQSIVNQLMMTTENRLLPKNKEEKSLPYDAIIFLYEGNKRGSQTIAVTLLSQLVNKECLSILVGKQEVNETLNGKNLYVVTEEFQKKFPVYNVPLLVVEHLVMTEKYQRLIRGEEQHVFITS